MASSCIITSNNGSHHVLVSTAMISRHRNRKIPGLIKNLPKVFRFVRVWIKMGNFRFKRCSKYDEDVGLSHHLKTARYACLYKTLCVGRCFKPTQPDSRANFPRRPLWKLFLTFSSLPGTNHLQESSPDSSAFVLWYVVAYKSRSAIIMSRHSVTLCMLNPGAGLLLSLKDWWWWLSAWMMKQRILCCWQTIIMNTLHSSSPVSSDLFLPLVG